MPTAKNTTDDTTATATTRKSMHATISAQTSARRPLRSVRPERDPDPTSELRASQLFNVAVEEITWFYTWWGNDGPSQLARATIDGWLGRLDPAERRTLSLRFDHGIGVMRDIGRRADWNVAAAVRAYAKTRGRSPSALPRQAA